jgi:hypothetical protein
VTVEVLISGLWNPMEQWIKGNDTTHIDTSKFDELKSDLTSKNRSLTALDLERTCRMPVTVAFLKSKGLSEIDLHWVTKALPKSIYRLRQVRNEAEHESRETWSRERLSGFFEEFVGIGQSGILPRLTRLLL